MEREKMDFSPSSPPRSPSCRGTHGLSVPSIVISTYHNQDSVVLEGGVKPLSFSDSSVDALQAEV